MDDPHSLIADLDTVHDMLRNGRLGDLAPLTAAITAGLATLAAADDAMLASVQRRAARNIACLAAAAQGLRAARRRIAEIRSIEAGFVFYDKSGKREGPQPSQITQRF